MDISELTEAVQAKIAALEYTNEGNTHAFLELYNGRFHHNEQVGWLKWVGTHWSASGAEPSVKRAMLNTLKIRRVIGAKHNVEWGKYKRVMGETRELNGALSILMAMSSIFMAYEDFDQATGFLNVANGVLDLRRGVLSPHHPSQKFTYCIATKYKPEAVAPDWDAFLTSAGMDDETKDYIQKAVGYSMTGETSEEIMFYLYGKPRSGKGTFVETLALMMGELGTGVNFRSFTSERHGDTSNFDLAPLKNKRFLTASESSRFRQLNTAMIKQITGGDYIYCSFKRKDHFSYKPAFVVWLTSNWPINADVDDDAAWGRLKPIEFKNSFLGKEDKTLKPRLRSKASLEGVLAWAVRGAMSWYESLPQGLQTPDSVKLTSATHRQELDSIGAFVDEVCVIKSDAFTVGATLYTSYKDWCEDEGHKPRGRRTFTQSLEGKGITSMVKKVAGKGARGYSGIGIAA